MDPAHFVCLRCGACCRIPGGLVHVSDAEIDRMAAALALPPETFIERYTNLAPNRSGLVLKDHPDGSCIFLDAEGACLVHAVKPDQCRTFPFAWRNADSATACPGLRRAAEAARRRVPSPESQVR